MNETELIDPKIAPLIHKLYLQNDDKEEQEDRKRVLEDMNECHKALTMILEEKLK